MCDLCKKIYSHELLDRPSIVYYEGYGYDLSIPSVYYCETMKIYHCPICGRELKGGK